MQPGFPMSVGNILQNLPDNYPKYPRVTRLEWYISQNREVKRNLQHQQTESRVTTDSDSAKHC